MNPSLLRHRDRPGRSRAPRAAACEEYESRKAKGRKVEDTFEEYLDRTGLGGEFGRVVCLAYALNEQPADVVWG
ncbi:MAG: hypothetical protein WKG07_23970 [Hymenobacter sp.]